MRVHKFLVPDSISFESTGPHRTLITLEPFERGFGHTLGNALRRILLSSLSGSAVVEVKLEGAIHNYSTLEGVYEDVEDILLNLRGAAFIMKGERDAVMLELKKSGIGPVCLGDIKLPPDVEIVNPDYVIANLTQEREFNMALKVVRSWGEHNSSANNDKERSADIGILHMDAVFNPVQRVSFHVESKLGKLDRLIIDLETNGTVSPEEAIQQAAIILEEQLGVFSNLKRVDDSIPSISPEVIDPKFFESVDTLGLTARTLNCLKSAGLLLIGDIVTKTVEDLLHIPTLGKKSLGEIKKVLASYSLSLEMPCPGGWPPADLKYPHIESLMTED